MTAKTYLTRSGGVAAPRRARSSEATSPPGRAATLLSIGREQTNPFSIIAARGAAQLGRTVGVALANADLTPAAYRMLAYLTTGESAANILAAKLAVSRPTVTTTLDWLEPRGYVTRTPGTTDRRSVDISITDKGRAALDDADRRVVERLFDVTAPLDRSDVASIVEALETLHDALNAYRATTAPGVSERARPNG